MHIQTMRTDTAECQASSNEDHGLTIQGNVCLRHISSDSSVSVDSNLWVVRENERSCIAI